jgi:5-formyltetrahydrofolate cyclo-ligase
MAGAAERGQETVFAEMSAGPERIKAGIRRQLRAKLNRMTAAEREEASARIRERLAGQSAWQQARSILFFTPAGHEPDLWPLAIEAQRRGQLVALLRYAPATDAYLPCLIHDLAHDLQAGRFGILEPAAHCPIFDAKQLDLALVPGIGFTPAGGRLGRGKGYFDRLLAQVPGFKCGVAFDCQLVADLPLEPHDVRLNCILTPTRWHLVTGQPRF